MTRLNARQLRDLNRVILSIHEDLADPLPINISIFSHHFCRWGGFRSMRRISVRPGYCIGLADILRVCRRRKKKWRFIVTKTR